ncbi:glycohydrolase toxin TNT-related protein [Streptococcus sp. zg-70]|uniref:Glycohydrolase toxin TNT-related protein n=1 Tax=Streptococcus zhangguiae TaxID=2664091 RepID=A0A6I4RSU6_9STRE|nr:glycohydrolase toxin TNT-related protein [Streptococcus sp. zg-70]
MPKDASVLTPKGKIDWEQVPNGGYILDETGVAIKEEYIPKVGEIFDRYGPEDGRYTSPVRDGVPFTYEQRSLPYVEDTSKYYQYEVIGDFSDLKFYIDNTIDIELKEKIYRDVQKYYGGNLNNLRTYQGEIAPGFGAIGRGIQTEMPLSVDKLQQLGLLRKIK